MKKISLIVIFIFFCVTNSNADEFWQFTQVTCIKELGYFSLRGFDVHSYGGLEKEYYDFLDNGKDVVIKKYGILSPRDEKIHACRLKHNILTFQIKYRDMGDGHEPQQSLNVWENNRLIIDLPIFNGQGYRIQNINFVRYTDIFDKTGAQEDKRVSISGHDSVDDQFDTKDGKVRYFKLEFNLTKNRIINLNLINNTKAKEYISTEPLL